MTKSQSQSQATKEHLIAKVAELELRLKQSQDRDAEVRDRLSFVLGLPTVKTERYNEEVKIERSWIELFCEVGKLIAKRDYVSFTDRINDMDDRLMQTSGELRIMQRDSNNNNRP